MANQSPLREFLKDRFSLDKDKIDPEAVIVQVKQGIYFRGTNLWILIFAIFLASIGLNVNSTAVIIGAMLISPLMGPIIGIGLGAAINDFLLMRKSFINLLFAVIIGLITSTLYFLITPLNAAHSELLARTNPTVWDVFIALFGGLAGIIATSSKERGNVIPGVAIATALMPPLCTAGYGLAVGNLYYFGGAIYLFFINCVFICVAAYVVARALKFPYVIYPDQKTTRHVRRIVMAIVVITFVPSVYIAWLTVKSSIYEQNAEKFLEREMDFPDNYILRKEIDPSKKTIQLVYLGNEIDSLTIGKLHDKLEDYKLEGTRVIFEKGTGKNVREDYADLKNEITNELLLRTQQQLLEKDKQIVHLKAEIERYHNPLKTSQAASELNALFPGVTEIGISKAALYDLQKERTDTTYLVYCVYRKLPGKEEKKRLEAYLKARLDTDRLRLILEKR